MEREEAINLIKQVLPCLNIDEKIREGFVTLIPELAESEDERIRKELIEYLTHRTEVTGFIDEDKDCKRWIAYLEKQKNQKPAVEQLDGTFNSYDMAKTFVEGQYYVIEHPERFGLCKPVEWSEEDKTHLCWIIECFDSWKYQVPEFADQYQSAIDWLKSLRPSWKPSEEQMEIL